MPPSASIPSSSLLPYIHNTTSDIENVPPNTINQNSQSTISPTIPVIETVIPDNTS
jgi:hypothetical protein